MAGVLFLGQAGAAYAPVAPPSAVPAPLATTAMMAPATSRASSARFSAAPFQKMRIRTPAAALRLAPALRENSYASLAMGPIRFPDGALKLPGRLEPEAPGAEKAEVQDIGHSVSVPTAILVAEPYETWPTPGDKATNGQNAPAFAGLPLVSSAHAAETAGLGGPLNRMPIEGHIHFANGDDALTTATQAQLDRIVETLRTSHATLDVVAYGGDRSDRPEEARRLSLRRGLAVRAYLISRGIEHRRIAVRSVGTARDGGPGARADVFYASY